MRGTLRLLAALLGLGPVACGYCHACGEAVAPALRWCGAECRDLYEELHLRGKA